MAETNMSKRLQMVAGMVTPGMVLADIGTDHAYIPIELVLRGTVTSAIAMDVNQGPLDRAKINIAESGVSGKIDTRLSDGMQALLPGEVTSAVIAGMGGHLMHRILREGLERGILDGMKELILQPQSEVFKVRIFLRDNGWKIIDEKMLKEDGKFYVMMKAVHENDVPAGMEPEALPAEELPEKLDLQQLEDAYGPILIRRNDPVLQEYLALRRNQLKNILRSMEDNTAENVQKRKVELQEELDENRALRDFCRRRKA